jgi:ribulose-5-phosphate 4-epimerase/fuculose-1-phosphate aldolase
LRCAINFSILPSYPGGILNQHSSEIQRKGDITMSTEQALLRHDVALANRIIERFRLSSGFGHVSARIPGTQTFYFPTRRSPGLADENNLLTLDTDGNVLAGNGEPNSELWIHARIYAARPDVGSVVHAHAPACVCLTQIGEPLRLLQNQGGGFPNGVPEYGRIGLITSKDLGDSLAKTLGAGNSVMMRGHGITTALQDVHTATIAALLLEESADLQLRMLSAAGGDAKKLRVYTPEEAERVSHKLKPHIVARAWEYYSTMMESKSN